MAASGSSHLERILYGLAAGEGLAQIGTTFDRLSRRDKLQVLQLAMDHRVLLPVVEALTAAGISLAELSPQWKQRYTHRDGLQRQLDMVAQRLTELGLVDGVHLHLVKGLRLSCWYPEGSRRQFNDVDLYAADVNTVWNAGVMLQRLGFMCTGLAARRLHNELTTLVAVFAGTGEDGHTLRIDLSAGAYPIARCSAMSIPADALQDDVLLSAIILTCELHERRFIYVRDVIDSMHLFSRMSVTTFHRLLAVLGPAYLVGELRRLVRAALRVANDPPRLRDGQTLPLGYLEWSPLDALWQPVRGLMRHTVPNGLREAGSWRIAALQGMHRLGGDLATALANRGALHQARQRWSNRVRVTQWLDHGRFVPLAPIDRYAWDGVSWLNPTGQRFHLFLTPLGTFVTAPFGALDPQHVDAATEITARIREHDD